MRKLSWLHRSLQRARNEKLAEALAAAFTFTAPQVESSNNNDSWVPFMSKALATSLQPVLDWPGIVGIRQHWLGGSRPNYSAMPVIMPGAWHAGVTVTHVVMGDYDHMGGRVAPMSTWTAGDTPPGAARFSSTGTMTLLAADSNRRFLTVNSGNLALILAMPTGNTIDGHFAGVYDAS